ncbi:MAG: hypothetical protein H0W96_10125, partial [Solirubrobacterales bacterium]|nr:hypothetical protein [Solirubrobacterales bacterium]
MAHGHVTQAAMDAALHASRAGRRYSEILIGNGDVSDDDFARTLADHYRIDHVDLDVFEVDIEIKRLVPMSAARRLGALPVAQLPTGEIAVAVYDPESLTNMGEIAKNVGREVVPVIASRSQVERHIALGIPAAAAAPAPPPAAPAAAA